MSIFQPGDFPIDANVVDGTELAARLNRMKSALDNQGLVSSATAPAAASVVIGSQWLDTSSTPPSLKVWDGSAWQSAGSPDAVVKTPAAGASQTIAGPLVVSPTGFANTLVADASGNVGIGTASPSFNVDVQTAGDAVINSQSTGTIQSARVRIVGRQTSVDEEWNIVAAGAGLGGSALRFVRGAWTNTPAALIDSSNNLLVGATSQIGAGKTGIQFDQITNWGLAIKNSNATNTGSMVVFINNSGGTSGAIVESNASTVAYNTSSDYRLKENIAPMTGALEKVAALKPVTYTWKADGSAGQGFIAHELQSVVPDCVTGEKDAVDAEGKPQYQGVDTSFLVATLVAAIQELKADVDALKAAHP